MQTMSPASRLDDPGIGLRGNGRRVLTYADLRSLFADPDGRKPGRAVELHLTGHMERFVWSFDGIKFSDAEPVRLTYGERARIVLVNDTMMAHPIHLHGMWSDIEDDDGRFHLRKHVVDMPPGTRRSFLGHAVAEVLLLGIGTHVREGQHRDGRHVRLSGGHRRWRICATGQLPQFSHQISHGLIPISHRLRQRPVHQALKIR